MKKFKNVCKHTLSYIKLRGLLKYTIIIIVLLLPIGSILVNKILNSKDNSIVKIEEQVLNNKDVTKGKINADVASDIEYSRHTLSDGFSTLSDDDIATTSSSSNNKNNVSSNTSSSTSHNVDKSSISGIDLEILEGHEFNPKKDLKLQATDKDGSNISDNIVIEKNNVNTTVPGVYSVKASIRLSNGQSKEKEFTVTVKETRLDVSLETFKPLKTSVQKGEKIGFEIELKVSKNHITPTAVMLNGQEYSLYKGNQNIIDVLTNKKNYKVFINEIDTSGLYEYNLEHVKMSNGAWISLGENITTVEVLKEEASVSNFYYEEQSLDKKIEVKFNLDDIDNTASNIRLELYKDNNLLENIRLDKMANYSIHLPVNSNGVYNLKILSDINLNQNININKGNIIFDKEIFETIINVSNIDQTSITGNDIEIMIGDNFDFMKDLDLKATDFDGEDITNNIKLDGNNIDVNVPGKQSIVVSIINKHGKKYTKEFYIMVNPTTKSKNNIETAVFKKFINKTTNQPLKSKAIISGEKETLSHSVTMTGIVNKSDGTAPNGKLIVEIPTAMSFIVDKNGSILSGNYTVENKSSEDIGIFVESFIDGNPNRGIEVWPTTKNISNLDRTNINLTLHGNTGNKIDLADIQKDKNHVLTVKPLSSEVMQLTGNSGKFEDKIVDKNGVEDKFILIFRIKKI